MSFSLRYTECTNCDLHKRIAPYSQIEFRPKEGVMESVLELKYCESCETYTKWFMGRGKFPDPPSGLYENPYKNLTLPELNSILDEKKVRLEILRMKVDRLSNNTFKRLLFFKKLYSLKRERIILFEVIKELKNYIDESERNLDFYIRFDIDFYEKLGVKPKCMTCGYDKLMENPKHSCGGDLVIVPSRDMVHPIFEILHICEYDEYGNIVSRKPAGWLRDKMMSLGSLEDDKIWFP